MGKGGFDRRELAGNVNFFSRVDVAEDGSMSFAVGNSKAGDFVEIRAEMNVLVILNTCQHPLDPNPRYAPKSVKATISRVQAPSADDHCRISRAENGLGVSLTERYIL